MTAPDVSIVIAAYNAADTIPRAIGSALAQQGVTVEVIVADDCSTDETRAVVSAYGDPAVRLVALDRNRGPGGARNQASNLAAGDILWFVDADVVVHEDAARCLLQGFDEPGLVAVFGSYDDRPPAQNFFSQYKNLVHHFYHQRARKEAATFWSGCGAVRRDAFLQAGGFDVSAGRLEVVVR